MRVISFMGLSLLCRPYSASDEESPRLLDQRFGILGPRRDLEAALHRRAGGDRVEPAPEMAEAVDADPRPFVGPRPAEIGDVGDQIVAGQISVPGEPAVEHLQEAPALAPVAVD